MLETIINWSIIAIWVICAILLFGLAIIVHEYGHFLAAKLLGFRIDAFSVGFGPAIWKKEKDGITYKIGCIPLGGYVALPQLDPSEMDAIQGDNKNNDEETPYPPVPAWKRMIVAVAGPLGNVVLAVIVAFIIYFFATDDKFGGIGNTIGSVTPNSQVEKAGLQAGDKIIALNGNIVSCWNEIEIECVLAAESDGIMTAQINRNGKNLTLKLPVKTDKETGYATLDGAIPKIRTFVGNVSATSPADNAGIKVGDQILAVNGKTINGPNDVVKQITENGTKELKITIQTKSKEEKTITLTPTYNEELKRPLIGITFAESEAMRQPWMEYRRPTLQLSNDAKGVFRILRALFKPRAKGEAKSAAKGIGGAVTLFYIFWMQIQAGFIETLAFLRYLCINLAILNLLPIPVLDGGHILFALLEMITRRKIPAKVIGAIYNIFAFALIAIMIILIFRDSIRFVKIHKVATQQTTELVEENAND